MRETDQERRKNYTGIYNNKLCSEVKEKGEGQYELEPFHPLKGDKLKKSKAFKGKGGGSFLEDKDLEGTIKCKKFADSGEFTGPKTVGHIKVAFSGCEKLGKSAPASARKPAKSSPTRSPAKSATSPKKAK